SLPGEVTDQIISLVPERRYTFHGDHQTLFSCALVCQEWLPASRVALLEDVHLGSKAAYKSHVEHVLHPERINHYLQLTRILSICD
ncbi:hypothetical protein C8T65DRAFT_552195, partial [Cerioporus squamosus]